MLRSGPFVGRRKVLSISNSRLRWGLVALLAAAAAAAVFITQPRPASHDASIWVVVGRGMLEGRPPFLGIWDYKPPAIYLVGALAWILDPGDTTVSMQALTVVAIAAAATAGGWLVATVYSRFWVGVATAAALAGGLSLPALSYGGGMSELFGVAWLAVCFAIIAGIVLGRRGLLWPAAAGAIFALAVGSSFLTVGAVPALAVLWLSIPIDGVSYPPTRSNMRTWFRRRVLDGRLGVAIAAAAVVSLVVWWTVLAGGAVPAAIDAFVHYQSLYRAAGHLQPRAWVRGILDVWPLWIPTLIVCLTPTARGYLLGLNVLRSNFARAMLVWLVVELALLGFGQRFYARYLLLIVPPLIVLFGFTLCTLWVERPRISRGVLTVALCAAVAVGLLWQSLPTPSNDPQIAANADLAAYVRANSAPGETIYVWGTDPDLYLRSDRQPAGPYLQIHPLIMPGYDQKAVATMLDQWTAHPPRLVVASRATNPDLIGLYPLNQSAAMTNPLRTYYAALAPLQSFIQSHYDLVATLPIGEVWRYRG